MHANKHLASVWLVLNLYVWVSHDLQALFHASQLRQGLADLKRYDRREAAAGAVYQYKALQDTRDADGIRHKASER